MEPREYVNRDYKFGPEAMIELMAVNYPALKCRDSAVTPSR